MESITSLYGKRKSVTFGNKILTIQANHNNNKASDLVVGKNLDFSENTFIVLPLSAW